VNKFKSMVSKYMSGVQINQTIGTIFELDKLEDIGKLNKLMVFLILVNNGLNLIFLKETE
jgi:hypothetical protein